LRAASGPGSQLGFRGDVGALTVRAAAAPCAARLVLELCTGRHHRTLDRVVSSLTNLHDRAVLLLADPAGQRRARIAVRMRRLAEGSGARLGALSGLTRSARRERANCSSRGPSRRLPCLGCYGQDRRPLGSQPFFAGSSCPRLSMESASSLMACVISLLQRVAASAILPGPCFRLACFTGTRSSATR